MTEETKTTAIAYTLLTGLNSIPEWIAWELVIVGEVYLHTLDESCYLINELIVGTCQFSLAFTPVLCDSFSRRPSSSSQTAMPEPERSLSVIQYILFCMNIITWVISIVVIGLCFWLRFNDDIQDWVDQLGLQRFYIGLYILIVSSFLLMATGFLSCIGTFSRNRRLIAINVLVQLGLFILGLAGAAVLLDNSTFKSSIHAVIKDVMVDLIQLHPSYGRATVVLQKIQENVGCCGGSSYNDYINLQRALPTECRDPVTGNTYFYGCADEISWRLEAPATWIAGLVLFLCAKKVVNAVLSTIMIQLIVQIENDK